MLRPAAVSYKIRENPQSRENCCLPSSIKSDRKCLTKNFECELACGTTSSKGNRLLNLIMPYLRYSAKKPCQRASVDDGSSVSKTIMKAWKTKNIKIGFKSSITKC
ncbi:hypothetical protein OESDEN_09681 [Oesophagostomum dentatum]|uniref:Uncharacterized protein n=1 Tax=Oesophagostomum dentatum TaxID=61180 RepID=A0A0B1T4Z9_OESDE|nr:hypothetical protein OESDEN_09681 [Oesophagostomum dentatum]